VIRWVRQANVRESAERRLLGGLVALATHPRPRWALQRVRYDREYGTFVYRDQVAA
jgi:hypothetical protein